MNQYTHDVLQFVYVDAEPTAKPIKAELNNGVEGTQLFVEHSATDIESTDIIGKVLSWSLKKAADDIRYTKVATVELAKDPVAGQEYILSLSIADEADQENTIEKTVGVIATSGMTQAQLLTALKAELDKVAVIEDQTLFTASVDDTTLTLVEGKPYYSYGAWPETLAKIDVSAPEIWVNGVQEDPFKPIKFVESTSGEALPNSRRIADLEYFGIGEKGNINFLAGFPYNIPGKARIGAAGAEDADGYSVLAVHYAYIGPDAANQKSERDILFVAKAADEAYLETIKGLLDLQGGSDSASA